MKLVTNGYGQTHDVVNLFLAGSGLFPTTGAVNPTFTINALSLRAAEYINAKVEFGRINFAVLSR